MKRLTLMLLAVACFVPAGLVAKTSMPVTRTEAIRHELAMLPRYGVFDNLAFSVDGGTVTLSGHVTQPLLKQEAAEVARRVEGVAVVVNNIEVLPLSPFDDRLRLAVYRSIYSAPSLSTRYGFRASPSIHIVVKNGVVSLEGVVSNAADRNVAGMRALSVFGSFSVENHLRVGS